ncbi:hypothetical protein [Marinobacter sp.]|uniref:hypothetical protein n=1 Tax=Marinobacter sp. TaxID=50741 RepID=UPI003A90D056
MKRLVIGSLVAAFLMVSAPAMADNDNGRGSGWQKHHERGQAMPPGHQKKFLQAHYRSDHYDRHHDKRKHQKWDRKHHSREERHHYYGKKHKRDVYRDRYDRYDRYNRYNRYDRHDSGHYRIKLGYGDGLPPEARIGRIIHDTHVLVESSRR